MNPTTTALGVTAALVPTCALTVQTAGDTVYTRADLTAPLPTTQFVALVHQDLHRPPTALLTWGTGLNARPAGTSYSDFASPVTFDSYGFVGLVTDVAAFSLVISFADPASALGQPFAAVFPGLDEGSVIEWMQTGNPLIQQFMDRLDTTPGVASLMGQSSTLLRFSTDGSGSAYFGNFAADFSPIPAPAASSLFLLSAAATRRRR